jgi:hypothetical protein
MAEIPVNPNLKPFLVSSSKGPLWVNPLVNKVRAAWRPASDLGEYFLAVVREVTTSGREQGWGNVHPLSKEGVQAAIDHVRYYDFEELELLANPETDWGSIHPDWKLEEREIPLTLLGVPLQGAPWLPPNIIICIPRDREFVGFVMLYHKHMMSVVHNGSRGIGIATAEAPEDGEE